MSIRRHYENIKTQLTDPYERKMWERALKVEEDRKAKRKEYMGTYVNVNKDQQKNYYRNYSEEHAEKIKLRQREWYLRNKEKLKQRRLDKKYAPEVVQKMVDELMELLK